MGLLRGILSRCVLVVATFLLALSATVIILIVPRWSNVMVHAGRIWARIMLASVGARVRFHDRQRANEHTPCIFIANHQSMIDIRVMLVLIPASTRFVAKQELFRIPVFGWVLSASGCIPIDRLSRADAIRSLGLAADRIRDGRSVVLYPEGTRSLDGRLRPFKKGAFHLALQAGVPIVPVAITGSFDVLPPRTLRVNPGEVHVYLEPIVDVAPFEPNDYRGLRAKVQTTIERRFHATSMDPDDGAVQAEAP